MEKRELKKPRKVVWVMRDFANAVSNLYWMAEADFDGENYSNEVWEKRMVKFEQGRNFSTIINDPVWMRFEEYIRIFYNFDNLSDYTMKEFRKDFVSRCPMGRGFANITLTLLHELGHHEALVTWKERNQAEAELVKRFEDGEIDKYQLQKEYFQFPDEKAATDWAIEWLKDPAHRKIAKAFEKKFFACFKKA